MTPAQGAAVADVLAYLAHPTGHPSPATRRRLDASIELLGHAATTALAVDVLPLAQQARSIVDERLRRLQRRAGPARQAVRA